MQYDEYDVLPPSAVAENVGSEAIGMCRRAVAQAQLPVFQSFAGLRWLA